MPRKPRIHYTETDKALMWDRWRKGGLCKLGQYWHRPVETKAVTLQGQGQAEYQH